MLSAARNINPAELNQAFNLVKNASNINSDVEPIPYLNWPDEIMDNVTLPTTTSPCILNKLEDTPHFIRESWTQFGLHLIYERKVAALVMAGGQGTRLGFNKPKGMFPAGAISKKSLFQFFAERIRKVQELADIAVTGKSTYNLLEETLVEKSANAAAHSVDNSGTSTTINAPSNDTNAHSNIKAGIPFVIMVNNETNEEIQNFFAEHNYFGLRKEDVIFFNQEVIPALDYETGRILMQSPSEFCLSPNGNGGLFTSMESSGVSKLLESLGVVYVHVFSVDNPLSKTLDPTMLGFLAATRAPVGNKCVEKVDPMEKVGVMALKRRTQRTQQQPSSSPQPPLQDSIEGEGRLQRLKRRASTVVLGLFSPQRNKEVENIQNSDESNSSQHLTDAFDTISSQKAYMDNTSTSTNISEIPQICVIEYSELSHEQRHARLPSSVSASPRPLRHPHAVPKANMQPKSIKANAPNPSPPPSNPTSPPSTSLSFSAANIANHTFVLSFMRQIAKQRLLANRYHGAHKAVPYWSFADNKLIIPETPNAIKLELFIFDSFEFARRVAALIVDRKDEFAPIKNKSGSDSLESAISIMTKLYRQWITCAGGSVSSTSGDNATDSNLEISPLISYEGESLGVHLPAGRLRLPLYIDTQNIKNLQVLTTAHVKMLKEKSEKDATATAAVECVSAVEKKD